MTAPTNETVQILVASYNRGEMTAEELGKVLLALCGRR